MKVIETTDVRSAATCGQRCTGCRCGGLRRMEDELYLQKSRQKGSQLYATEAEEYYYYERSLLNEGRS